MILALVLAAGWMAQPASAPAEERTALFDEVWDQLSRHDPFFDPDDPAARRIHDEFRARIAATPDELERVRHIVRALSRLGDGHTHLSSRWFLPDKPPPPLPLAGKAPLYRAPLGVEIFHRDPYMRLEFPDEPRDGPRVHAEYCRIREIDGAVCSIFSGWDLIYGPKDSRVEMEFERPDGRRIRRSFVRNIPVNPPKHFAPTTQVVVTQPAGGKPRVKEVEVIVVARRLAHNLGYIQLRHLVTQQATDDFNAALDGLMDTDGLVLDLRNNHGGYPWIMLPIAGRFFDKYQKVCSFDGKSPLIGPLVRLVGKVGIPPFGQTYRKPVVVLIDDATASMGEGLAFCLGDTGRAVLVGRPTMGLNAAIRNTTLSNGLVLWHSWIRVNRLNGEHYQGIGVQPTERVELTPDVWRGKSIHDAVKLESQRQLDRAVEKLRQLVAAAADSGR